MHSISAFILTLNSGKYLERILHQLNKSCDEVVVVDSGSMDATEAITLKNHGRFLSRTFDNFRNQRTFALQSCAHDLVLMIDSDEIPDDILIAELNALKSKKNLSGAYRLRRERYVLGRKVHAAYPEVSPDYPVRLFNRRISNFDRSD